MGSLDESFSGSNDDKLDVLFLVDSRVYTDDKALSSDEGIKLGLSGGKVLGTILGNVNIITLGVDIVTYMSPLDESFGGSNDGNLEGLFLGESLGYTYGKVLGADEGIKL